MTGPRDPLGISGTVIADKYKIAHAVGEGGFSVVYLAEHMIWKQPVAIKCFKILANAPEDQRDKLLDGFIQEGKLMAQLSSRSAAIVQARDVGTFTSPEGQWLPYMVLEWLEGKPLDLVLWEEHRAGLPARSIHETMALLEPAAAALEIVHSKGVAHRDVKPANFFVIGDARSSSAHMKVLDFGIAKVMADHAAAAAALAYTGKELTAFTPNYGAPEQFSRSHGATGPWTDVFAMALIVVEILRGGQAALDGADFMQLAIASRDPQRRPTPRGFGVPVSDAVEQVFLTALAISPADRYASMGQFWSALTHAVSPGGPTWPGQAAGGFATAQRPQPYGTAPASQQQPYGGAAMSQQQPYGGAAMSQQQPYGGAAMSQQQPYGAAPPSQPIYPSAPMGMSGPSQTALQGAPMGAPMSAPSLLAASATPAPPVTRPSSKAPLAIGAFVVVLLAGGTFGALKMFGGPAPTASAEAPSASAPIAAAAPASASAAAARRTECPEGTVLVPGGKFFMGSDEPQFKLWQPAHKVTLDTFCIGINEVTAGEYKACSDQGECKRPEPVPDYPKSESTTEAQHEKNKQAYSELCNFGKPDRDKHPINCISWTLADAYCKVKKMRLPTEAEWEYAARGSDGRKYPWGDEPGDMEHMNACGLECNKWEAAHGLKPSQRMFDADDGFPGTAPVGSFPKGKTKFGANDFVGNVWEWTSDWFETYKPDEAVNPKGGAAGEKKAIRGGGFNGGVQLWLNPAFRFHQVSTASAPGIGFRCATNL